MIIFDCETDGLLDKATKIHVLSYTRMDGEYHTLTDYDDMRELLNEDDWFVCHNAIRFDVRIFRRFLGVDIEDKVIDSLPLSWYLYPKFQKHGLNDWGKRLGIKKPEVEDWVGLSIEQYTHRCEEDVKINERLWKRQLKHLLQLYTKPKAFEFIKYLMFKMKCAAEQEDVGWHIDRDRAQRNVDELTKLQEERIEELKPYMPKVPKYTKRTPPAKPRRQDGTLSVSGMNWIELCEEHGLPFTHNEPIKVITHYEEPNPNSADQVKAWLFGMGWKPCTYKYEKNKDGTEREIPQIRDKGELTPSVKRLIDDFPEVELLEGLSVIQHRLSIFQGFLEGERQGKVKAQISGLTNTLRFKHKKPLVNLPGVDKAYGKEVRGCLVAPPGMLLCGSDMASLESNTKKHFMYPYDPEYVEEMSQPDFDEHLDLGVRAGYLDEEDYKFYARSDPDTVNDIIRFKDIKKKRTFMKPVNYGSTYGIGKLKLSRTLGCSIEEAEKLLTAYWTRNWAVKELVKHLKVKRAVNGQRWLQNPVNGFYYSLRYDKDRFSTLNQGTGVYCFDTWLAYCRASGVVTCGQFHDEYIGPIKPEEQEENTKRLKDAIRKVNDQLKLNVELDVGIQYGETYADIH